MCRSIICTQTINQSNNSSLLVRQPAQPCSASVEATAICFAGRSHSDFQQTAQIENLLNLIIVSSLLSANMKDSGMGMVWSCSKSLESSHHVLVQLYSTMCAGVTSGGIAATEAIQQACTT